MARSTRSRRPPTSSQCDEVMTDANVTLPIPVGQDWFPCPLCQGLVPVKSSKKDKPYVVCDLCGVQMFVRKPEGVRRLGLMLSRGPTRGSMRLSRLLELHDYLARRLDEVRKITTFHGGDTALDEEENLLLSQRKTRETLINALREKKRELQGQKRDKAK